MNWFERLCRNTGLMLHNVRKPGAKRDQKQVVNKSVEEKQIDEKTIVRRTVIDEIEIKQESRDPKP